MKGGNTPLGYTILEVMIVLAVSGTMFAIAANFIGGKQARTAFTSGVNEMASRIQDVAEQVRNGQYSDISLNCQYTGGNVIFPPGPTRQQGSNSQCVFLGKLLHFNQKLGSAEPQETYEIFSIAGSQVDSSGKPTDDPAQAHPTVIPDLTNQEYISQRLSVEDIVEVDKKGPKQHDSIFGFLQGLGTTDKSGSQATGVQGVGLYYVSNTPFKKDGTTALDTTAAVSRINSGSVKAAKSAKICLTDGVRYAIITLGVNNNSLTVDTVFKPGASACF